MLQPVGDFANVWVERFGYLEGSAGAPPDPELLSNAAYQRGYARGQISRDLHTGPSVG